MPEGRKAHRSTIHEVAARAGVSAATVSKVLNGVKTVKPANVLLVRKAVAELNYSIDPFAAGLRQRRHRIIAVVVPDLENEFFGALVTSLERAAEAAGYDVIIASSRESASREAELVAHMNDWRVAGFILAPVRSERGKGAQVLRDNDSIAVLVDRVSADKQFTTVTADNFSACAKVAERLVADGHRHVLLHGAAQKSKAVRTRIEGFSTRARALVPDIRIDTLLIDGTADEPGDGMIEKQRVAIRQSLAASGGDTRPTAVFSLSQHSTLLVLSEIQRLGLRCPDEISLIGFDDVSWMRTTWPSISAVAQPVRVIAERAITALLKIVEGQGGFPVQHLEPCKFCERQSNAPAAGHSVIRQEMAGMTKHAN